MQSKLARQILWFAALVLGFGVAPGAALAGDEPLTVTVEAQSSTYLRVGNPIAKPVIVAASDIADVVAYPPDHVVISGKRPGTTSATFISPSGEVKVLLIEVTFPLDAMRAGLIKAIRGGSKLEVQSSGLTLLLSGEVESAEDVARAEALVRALAAGATAGAEYSLLNMLTVPGDHQVQLEVSFAEVSRSSLRQIGFNFWSKGNTSNGTGYGGGLIAPTHGLDTLAPELGSAPDVAKLNASATDFDQLGLPLTDAVPIVSAPLQGAFGFVFSSTLGGFPFSAALSLLSNKGYARTLAEPTLVAMSGKHASFIAGGEFPVPLPQSLGQIAVEYRKFGVQLEFTPTVVGDDIQLDLGVTVSDIDFSLGVRLASTTVPGITERQSRTTVRMKDGQSFVIAGLLSDRVRSSVDKVPGLGDLPVLGALFRSSSYRREETELLVVVTAHQVKPGNERPSLPGENETTDPGDLALFLLGRSESSASSGDGDDAGNGASDDAGDDAGDEPGDSEDRRPKDKAKPIGAVGFQR